MKMIASRGNDCSYVCSETIICSQYFNVLFHSFKMSIAWFWPCLIFSAELMQYWERYCPSVVHEMIFFWKLGLCHAQFMEYWKPQSPVCCQLSDLFFFFGNRYTDQQERIQKASCPQYTFRSFLSVFQNLKLIKFLRHKGICGQMFQMALNHHSNAVTKLWNTSVDSIHKEYIWIFQNFNCEFSVFFQVFFNTGVYEIKCFKWLPLWNR